MFFQYHHTGKSNRAGIYIPNGLNQYTQVNDVPIEYDGNGNLVVDGDRTYIYDDENRLTEITDSSATGAVNATFNYDPLGRLFEVVINGERRQFLYDGDALIAEYTSGTATTPIRRYVHGDQVDEPLMEYHGSSLGASARRYLHANHQGSIIAHTNQSGSAVAKLSYDAYGIPGDGNVGRFAYTGQIWFEELGLYHYKARMYSPTLGRFLQTDPIFYEDQMNLYAYVHNDPINSRDPSGLYTIAGYNLDGFGEAGQYLAREDVNAAAAMLATASYAGGLGCVTFCPAAIPFLVHTGNLATAATLLSSDSIGVDVAADVITRGSYRHFRSINGAIQSMRGERASQLGRGLIPFLEDLSSDYAQGFLRDQKERFQSRDNPNESNDEFRFYTICTAFSNDSSTRCTGQ